MLDVASVQAVINVRELKRNFLRIKRWTNEVVFPGFCNEFMFHHLMLVSPYITKICEILSVFWH